MVNSLQSCKRTSLKPRAIMSPPCFNLKLCMRWLPISLAKAKVLAMAWQASKHWTSFLSLTSSPTLCFSHCGLLAVLEPKRTLPSQILKLGCSLYLENSSSKITAWPHAFQFCLKCRQGFSWPPRLVFFLLYHFTIWHFFFSTLKMKFHKFFFFCSQSLALRVPNTY